MSYIIYNFDLKYLTIMLIQKIQKDVWNIIIDLHTYPITDPSFRTVGDQVRRQ